MYSPLTSELLKSSFLLHMLEIKEPVIDENSVLMITSSLYLFFFFFLLGGGEDTVDSGNSFSSDFYSFMLTLNPITTTTKKLNYFLLRLRPRVLSLLCPRDLGQFPFAIQVNQFTRHL